MSPRLIAAVLCLALLRTGHAGGQAVLRSYQVDQERSSLFVATHRAGLLSFLGHEHAIVPGEWSAELCLADPIPRFAYGRMVIQSSSLVIDTDSARALAGLGDGPGEDDVVEIQRKMLDSDHLDAQAYPEIVLETDSVAWEGEDFLVGFGRLDLRGIARDVAVPMRIESLEDGSTRISGMLKIRQREFGIEPESKAGLVKVSDDVDLHFLLVVEPTDRQCTSRAP